MTNTASADFSAIPVSVQNAVRYALQTLRDTTDLFERGRKLDARFGGGGRYEWEIWGAIIDRDLPVMRRALGQLSEFRKHAPEHGVDAEAFIASVGGMPDILPGPKGIAFVTDDGRHPMPEKFEAYMKEFKS